MKSTILLLFLIVSFGIVAQYSDTTCIKSRWIAVKKTDANAPLFNFDESNVFNSLLGQVKNLVEGNKLNIYNSEYDYFGRQNWYAIPPIERHLELYQNDSTITRREDYFTIAIQSDMALVDEYGNPLVMNWPDGSMTFVYPPPIIYSFTMNDIIEVRIKETRLYEEMDASKFTITGFSFCHNFHGIVTELFWVDAIEFKKVLASTNFPWYDFLFENKYSGFQFMQTSCYE